MTEMNDKTDQTIKTLNTKEGEMTLNADENTESPHLVEGEASNHDSNEGTHESNAGSMQPAEEQVMTGEKRYIIDPEFRDLLPAKTPEQYNRLKEVIRAEGFRDDIVVWDETSILTDGHNRDQIYEELRKEMQIEPPKISRMPFADRDAAKMWIIQNQLNRRNLKTFQRIESVLYLKEIFVAQAKANKQAGVPLILGEGSETDKKLAELADSSPDIVRKARRILEKANDRKVAESINALRRGEKGVTISSAYKEHCVNKQAVQSPPVLSDESGSESETASGITGSDDIPDGAALPHTIMEVEVPEKSEKEQVQEFIANILTPFAGTGGSRKHVITCHGLADWLRCNRSSCWLSTHKIRKRDFYVIPAEDDKTVVPASIEGASHDGKAPEQVANPQIANIPTT
jgi:hypothetical protein